MAQVKPSDPYYNTRWKIAQQIQQGAVLLVQKTKQYDGKDEFGGLYHVSIGPYTPAVPDKVYKYQVIFVRKPNRQREKMMRERGIEVPPPQEDLKFSLSVDAAQVFVDFVGATIAREGARKAQANLDANIRHATARRVVRRKG